MAKQDCYTKSAKGQPCQVRVPFVCKQAPENETTVLAHLNGGGMAAKHLNIHGAYACAACHTWLDGGYVKTHTRDQRDLYHYEAMVRTQVIMVEDNVLKIN